MYFTVNSFISTIYCCCCFIQDLNGPLTLLRKNPDYTRTAERSLKECIRWWALVPISTAESPWTNWSISVMSAQHCFPFHFMGLCPRTIHPRAIGAAVRKDSDAICSNLLLTVNRPWSSTHTAVTVRYTHKNSRESWPLQWSSVKKKKKMWSPMLKIISTSEDNDFFSFLYQLSDSPVLWFDPFSTIIVIITWTRPGVTDLLETESYFKLLV